MKEPFFAKKNPKYYQLLLLLVCSCKPENVTPDSGTNSLEIKNLEQKINDLSEQVRDNQKFTERSLAGEEAEFSDKIIELAGLNNVSDGGAEKLKELAYKINRKKKLETEEIDKLKNALIKIKEKKESLYAELFAKHWKGFLLYNSIVMRSGITQDQETAVKEEWRKIVDRQIINVLSSREYRLSMKHFLKNDSQLTNHGAWLRLEYYHKSMTPIESPLLDIMATNTPITSTQYTERLDLLREKELAIICYHNLMELAVLEGELECTRK